MIDRPLPFDEDKDPNPFWKQGPKAYTDSFDRYIPRKGLLTDLIYYWRGTEVPTIYSIWAGLFLLSSVVKREAWIKWFPSDLYANIYVMLVGPSGCKKGSAINVVTALLNMFQGYITDHNIKKMKRINVIKNKATPEGLLSAMKPVGSFTLTDQAGNPLLDQHGREIKRPSTSEMAIIAPEMTVMINKQRYTESMVQNLTDLYDPVGPEGWDWKLKNEKAKLKNTFTSFIAGTTVDGFHEGVPPAAAGDGFLCRSIVVCHFDLERHFLPPRSTAKGPTKEQLAERVAYIAETIQGEYKLSNDAWEYLDTWYTSFRKTLARRRNDRGFMSRMDVHLMKTAFLLKVQRYPERDDKTIGIEDVKEAEKLLDATVARSHATIVELKDASPMKEMKRVEQIIEKKGHIKKNDLIRSTHLKGDKLAPILTDLLNNGIITVHENYSEKDYVELSKDEVYIYDKN